MSEERRAAPVPNSNDVGGLTPEVGVGLAAPAATAKSARSTRRGVRFVGRLPAPATRHLRCAAGGA